MRDPIYTLTKVDFDNTGEIDNRITHEFSAVDLSKVMRNMTYFLRGCSYVIPEMDTLTLRDESEV